ncbi:MAG: hypothetical protein NWE92_03480 [Candidatus Bathyarchaeota archaeon]|nr:hypothetical protein [Candidatus Bathyarchaeota archaeon]
MIKSDKINTYSPINDESKLDEIRLKLNGEPANPAQLLVNLVEVSLRLYAFYCSRDTKQATNFSYFIENTIKEFQSNSRINRSDREFIKALLKYWNSKVAECSPEIAERAHQDTISELVKKSKFDEALDKLQEYYKESKERGNDEEAIKLLGDIGRIYRRKGESEDALYYFELASKNDPSYLFDVAYTLSEMSKFNESIEAYQSFLKIAPKNKFAWNNIGWSYLGVKDNIRALQSFERALTLDNEIQPLIGKATVYGIMKKYNQAIKILQEVLKKKPRNKSALINLTHIYNDCLHDSEKALYYAKLALKVHPNHFYSRPNLAEILVTVGQYDEAIKEAEATLPNKGHIEINMSMYFAIAVAYFLKGQKIEGELYLGVVNDIYNSLPSDFKNAWSYSGIRYFLNNCSLDQSIKDKLFKMLDRIEAIPMTESAF